MVAGRRGRLGREEAVQVTPTPKTGFRPFDAAPDIKLSEPQKGKDMQVAKKGNRDTLLAPTLLNGLGKGGCQ